MNKIEHANLSSVVDLHFSLVCKKLKKPNAHREYIKGSVYHKLALKFHEYSTQGKTGSFLFEYLFAFCEEIITEDIVSLSKRIEDIEEIKKKYKLKLWRKRPLTAKERQKSKGKKFKIVYTQLYNDIIQCFDYGNYVSNEFAYQVLNALGLDTCPYCNRQFVNTFISDEGKTRATLDHFYSKAEHPYLALSFYNLIPACYSCNSSIKGTKKFTFGSHLHPYQRSFEKLVAFTIDYKKVDNSRKYLAAFYADKAYMKIAFKALVNKNNIEYKKADRNIKDLCLEPLYNLHKDYVVELLQKEVVFRKGGYAKILARQFPKLFNTEHDVLRLLLGNYPLEKEFCRRPFSRLVRDISAELGLLDTINRGYIKLK